jgi:UDP-N-acetyl-D-galactosamine dehydrogenase
MKIDKVLKEKKIAIIGLGYVGLPLAVEFGKKYKTIGYDINSKRVVELMNGFDSTLEIDESTLNNVIRSGGLFVTDEKEKIRSCNVYIITVPTPTDKYNKPELLPLIKASEIIAELLKQDDIVIYESTVYPGVTEDICVPIIENRSNLKLNKGFFVGYSPERINPGDKEHTLTKILKITSGSNSESAELIDELYKSIIEAGTFKAKSIKVAEAAKVIENSQRDINIAFVNELSKIFKLLDIDTKEVLDAAGTKWNFLKFSPGLVGGHCIGVDPYYLSQKAEEVGYHPEIILAGRRVNDSMGKYVANEVIKIMIKKGIKVLKSSVLILGFTFKENCPDIRNTRVIDIINELLCFDICIDIFDPWADKTDVFNNYGLQLLNKEHFPDLSNYSGVILAVSHDEFRRYNLIKNDGMVLYDVKGFLPIENVDARL